MLLGELECHIVALTGWLNWLECHLVQQKFVGLIPSQGTCLGCGFHAQWGCVWDKKKVVEVVFES